MSEPSPTTIAIAETKLRLARIAEDETLARALTRLEAPLAAVADALAGLTDAEWRALCAEERQQADAVQQMRSAGFGTAGPLLPSLALGNRVLELVAERHPDGTREPPSVA
jgi:hypothetical protein